ncbi:hypothetical protein BC833DRAFT_447214 [Globomyces pollinis-pini]|nr:hypothetical protein BC833DRAFT_447214 [Globomyces pollinis-pini]
MEHKLVLEKIFKRIPLMKKAISDPARHEKILSFVSNECKSVNDALYMIDLGLLKAVHESISHEDERVVSLVVRLLGHIIGIDRESSAIFDLVLNEHASLLNFVFGQLESSKVDEIPAALKFGIIESIGSIVKSNHAFNWIRLNQPCLQQLCDSLNDTNLFIANATCKTIYEFDIVLGKLYSMFDTKENYCNALELLWNLSEIKMTEIHIINEKLKRKPP